MMRSRWIFGIIVCLLALAPLAGAQEAAAPEQASAVGTMTEAVPEAPALETPPVEAPPVVAPPVVVTPAPPRPVAPALPPAPSIGSIRDTVVGVLIRLSSALAILIIGYVIAVSLAGALGAVMERIGLSKRISAALGEESKFNASTVARKLTFWIVMLITFVAFFDSLNLPAITQPLNAFLGTIFAFAPRLIGAGIIFLVALLLAGVARWAVQVGLNATTVDQWLMEKAGIEKTAELGHAKKLGGIVYGLVFLLFFPAILDALGMNGLMEPVQNMVNKAVLILPNFLGAALILAVGWFIARILEQVTATLLAASSIDAMGQKAGFGRDASGQQLSKLGGVFVYTLVMIPVVISALNALEISAISGPATNMLNLLLAAVPRIFGAALILFVSYFVARLVADLVVNLLAGAGFNNIMVRLGLGSAQQQKGRMPSDAVGTVILVAILLFASIEAAEMLGFGIVASLIAQFVTFAGKVALAVVVLGLGLYLANTVRAVILNAGGSTAPLASQAARIAIIVFAGALALRQTGIAQDIVNLAFSLILGAVAVAVALAFGLGCRDIAAKQVTETIAKMRASK